jgi:hypothetical protein
MPTKKHTPETYTNILMKYQNTLPKFHSIKKDK